MKALLLTAAILAASPVCAGGPILAEDATVAEARPSSEGNWILPVLGIIALGLLIGSRETCFAPEPETEGGGC